LLPSSWRVISRSLKIVLWGVQRVTQGKSWLGWRLERGAIASLHSGREGSATCMKTSLLSMRLDSARTRWLAEPTDFRVVQAPAESYNLNGFKFGAPDCCRV